MRQWHPLFVELLRPMIEHYYRVETDMPVSDLPRQADIDLLRRTSPRRPPFQGLWRHLTTWNVLEFKGPTEDARRVHLHDLVEVGLGIHRRLNQQRKTSHESRLEPEETSFWYLADRPGHRFLEEMRELLRGLEDIEAGVWRATLLGHPLFIVRNCDVAVTPDSLPLHVLGERPPEVAHLVGEVVASREELVKQFAPYLFIFHNAIYQELKSMARAGRSKMPQIDWAAIVEDFGLENILARSALNAFCEVLI